MPKKPVRIVVLVSTIAAMLVIAAGATLYLGGRTAQGSVTPAANTIPDEVPATRPDPPREETNAPPAPPAEVLAPYTGPVEHIFFHPLIAYPERAFDGDSMSRGYNDWFVTVKEFNQILESLYQRDYILVDINSLYTVQSQSGRTVLTRASLLLPPHKKPLVLSIDDLNYYRYMQENGNVYKLILDEQGNIATYSVNPQGQEVVSSSNDIVPILDSFVGAHPDFSFHGAKGVIALTGYEGILGYRTNNPNATNYAQEKSGALQVVSRLKATGWTFASHSWGHRDMAKLSYNSFVTDTRRWKDEVEPLIGPTPVYIWPFGSGVSPTDPKFKYLLDQGFRVFAGVGPDPYLSVSSTYVLQDRRHIDGIALHSQQRLLQPLFDADQVIDPIRPSQY